MDELTRLRSELEAAVAERDQLRMFLQFKPDPGVGAWAWCCHCQESHPIDQPHVAVEESRARLDLRTHVMAELRGLKAEIKQLAQGTYTDRTLAILTKQIEEQAERIVIWKARFKQVRDWWERALSGADATTQVWLEQIAKEAEECPTTTS